MCTTAAPSRSSALAPWWGRAHTPPIPSGSSASHQPRPSYPRGCGSTGPSTQRRRLSNFPRDPGSQGLPSWVGRSHVCQNIAELGTRRDIRGVGFGERAILLPVSSVARRAGELISLVNLSDDVTGLLFVDPPGAATSAGLVGMLGEGATSTRVTLSEEADSAGLAADAGGVIVRAGPGSTIVYRLYHLDVGDSRQLPPGPRQGEAVDVIDQRSRWFTARHGKRGPR